MRSRSVPSTRCLSEAGSIIQDLRGGGDDNEVHIAYNIAKEEIPFTKSEINLHKKGLDVNPT